MKQFNYGPGRNPERTVVHCPTKELAQRVLRAADTDWNADEKMWEDDLWDTHNYTTCYNLKEGACESDDWYIQNGYDIIPAEEFLALNEEFTLPEKWAVKLDFQEAVDYANENGQCPPYDIDNTIAHFPSPDDDSTTYSFVVRGYTLLTKEQFLEHVWKKKDAKERNPFKVGDRLFAHTFGWAQVAEVPNKEFVIVDTETGLENVAVNIGLCSFTEYTLQGWSHERPNPEIKKGQLIYVKDNTIWVMRFFSHWEGDEVAAFDCQSKEGSTTAWPEYSLTNPLEEK